MKIILTKDVRSMGRAHETVEVADGHALNFLIPQQLAVLATPAAMRAAETRKTKAATDRQVQEQLIAQNLETLAEKRIVITKKANDKGHLYDAVGVPEILAAVQEQAHVVLPEDTIRIEHPFKEVGTHDVSVAHGEHFGKFTISIETEA
ncbi:MAG: 50S ribosomal protein L9 [Parcubacteria group bacterium 21-54-25]|nr:MAG: 50S ribosomal protein L9 [Parcubacteria group bacterium 21-54-25]HQU07787.1 50S ribosomal protein L9 [Candidatus Paceibacterota bacterium]